MDDIPKHSFLRKVKQIFQNSTYQSLLTSSLCVAALSTFSSCSEEEYYSKSVQMVVKEVAPAQFQIIEEKLVEAEGKTLTTIHYLDGSTEYLPFDSLWQRIDTNKPVFLHYNTFVTDTNLEEVVVYSAIGDMLSVDRRRQLYGWYQEHNNTNERNTRRIIRYYINEHIASQSDYVRSQISHSIHTSSFGSSRGFFSGGSHGHARG